MVNRACAVVAALFFLTLGALGQEHRWDISLNASAVLNKKTAGNGVTQTPTSGRGFLATLRLNMGAKHSIKVNYARSYTAEKYVTPTLDYRFQTNVTEFSGAYVFSPFETERFKPFLLGGAGAVVFNPYYEYIDFIPVSMMGVRQTQVGFLYGGGVDYRLPRVGSRFALRLQYRGLLFSAPNFKLQNLFTGAKGHMAEPSIGIVFKF